MEAINDCFRFSIGDLECLMVKDGVLRVPDLRDRSVVLTMDILCLLIKTRGHTVLVDTGYGAGKDPDLGHLLQNLQAAGVQPAEIDTVIFTHGHFDHVGGLADVQRRSVFPNARFFFHKKEWEHWISGPGLAETIEELKPATQAVIEEKLLPIQDRVSLVEDETEIVPGVKCVPAPGHTPGGIALLISSGSEQMFFLGDLVHHPEEFAHPESSLPFDADPEQAIRSRAEIHSRFVKPNVLVSASHFPFPGLGHVVREDGAWRWQPIEVAGNAG